MAAKPEVDLSKVAFNPSKSFTFQPSARKQQAILEITNNSTADIFVKFKNTNPVVYSSHPKDAMMSAGQKMTFKCMFKGLPKEKCGKQDRFTVVLLAMSKNVNKAQIKGKEHMATAKIKHKIQVIFPGVNDEKEAAQPTANDDEDENKDRQGRMRTKSKSEAAPQVKKPIVMMFTRKDGESLSDEDEGPSPASDAPPAAAAAPSDDMMTTRPAGFFNGQVASNETAGTPGAQADELRTTRPAGMFTGQVASAGGGGGAADPKSAGMLTTRPAGAFTGQVASNAAVPGAPVEPKSAGMLTTRPAGAFTGQVGQVPGAPGAASADPKSAGLMTTRGAGAFNGQVTPNNGGPSENPELKTTKQAGSYENPQQKNK